MLFRSSDNMKLSTPTAFASPQGVNGPHALSKARIRTKRLSLECLYWVSYGASSFGCRPTCLWSCDLVRRQTKCQRGCVTVASSVGVGGGGEQHRGNTTGEEGPRNI